MKLFFDTETSDKPDWHAPFTAPHQPHIVQLACLLTDDNGSERGCFHAIIQPDDWQIAPGAAAVHGITAEMAAAHGIPLSGAMDIFQSFFLKTKELIAHNINFDLLMLRVESARLGGDGTEFDGVRHVCTMQESTDVVRLPGFRRGKYKWPKLTEAYRHFHGRDFDGAHDAMADVRACAAVYFALRKNTCPAQTLSPAARR